MNSAQLELMRRRLAQQKRDKTVLVDQTENVAKLTNGGFRAGKRRRGNSLLKRKPRASTVVTTYLAKDEHGNTVAHVKTLTYKRPV